MKSRNVGYTTSSADFNPWHKDFHNCGKVCEILKSWGGKSVEKDLFFVNNSALCHCALALSCGLAGKA
jgi:hypothetical protein